MVKKLFYLFIVMTFIVVQLVGCTSKPAEQKTEKKTETADQQTNPKMMEDPWKAAVDIKSLPKPEKANKPYTIAVLVPHLRDPYWVAQAYGYFDEAKKYGVKVILQEAGGYEKIDKQVNQLDDMIAKGVDAIAVSTVDSKACNASIEKAVNKGIPVFNMVNMADTDLSYKIAPADWEIGKAQAEYIGEKLAKGKVAMLSGPPGASFSVTRHEGFMTTIKKYPGIEVVADKWSENDRAIAMSITEDFLQAFPDLSGIYSASDITGEGAVDAIGSAGKQGKIMITTGSISETSLDMLKKGQLAMCTGEQTVIIGRSTIQAAVAVLNGDKWPKLVKVGLQRLEKDTNFDLNTEFTPPGWNIPK